MKIKIWAESTLTSYCEKCDTVITDVEEDLELLFHDIHRQGIRQNCAPVEPESLIGKVIEDIEFKGESLILTLQEVR